MKAFYSVIYFQSNSFSSEKIAGGLLLFSPQNIWFEYLPMKLEIISKLMTEHVTSHLKLTLKGIEQFVKTFNSKPVYSDQLPCFAEPESFFNELYASYLNKYSQGILQYNEPQPIAAIPSTKLFNALFEKFVGKKKEFISPGKYNFHNEIQKKLNKPTLKEKVDINLKLNPQKFEGIYSETKISLIGKNGVLTAMQDIDFDINMETLGQHLNQWDVLVDALGKLSQRKQWNKGDYNLVFNKPKSNSLQEKLLNKVKKSNDKAFKLIDVNEVETIIAKVESNDYTPFTKLIV